MFRNYNKISKSRLAVIVLWLAGFLMYGTTKWYWTNVCALEGCSSYLKSAFLSPFGETGIVTAVLTAPFLFLPTHYFRNWFLWVFLPIFIWSLYRVSLINPDNSNMFAQTRAEVVAGMIYPWGVITVVFILIHWYRSRVRK